RAAAATRSPPTCSANGRTALRSSGRFNFRWSFLVIFRHQPVEQANTEAGAPALVDLVLRRAHCGAGDVEMRPWRAVDKALQELRSGDRATVSAAGVLHVGELGIDQLVVFRRERDEP